ncbi:hypothetical protein [Natronoglycomyces albus]|uniref:Uncharacterized protein n=1 Tax=Natronoglycomyces albus TaxID=2811108 RepID=A0A895XTK7_9ACTN|nr:hypothetical protein [Natronoglycomyces albus]QSB06645.1 hypothetical protein JQS30_07050 [Natronoglycomyces albus]
MSIRHWLRRKQRLRGPVGLGEWDLIGRRMSATAEGAHRLRVYIHPPASERLLLVVLSRGIDRQWRPHWHPGRFLGLDALSQKEITDRALALRDAYLTGTPVRSGLDLRPSPIVQERLEEQSRDHY